MAARGWNARSVVVRSAPEVVEVVSGTRCRPARGRRALRALVAVVALAAGCARSGPAPETREYELVGQVLAVRPESSELLVRHEDIEGFMPGMTMPFRVQDAVLLDGVEPGDLIRATLAVADGRGWLTAIEKTGSAPLPEVAAAFPAAAGAHVLELGDAVPDTTLTDQDGRPVRLSDWRGRLVAVTFIFTRCPLPEFCPLMDRRFAEIQRAAAADAALAGRVRLLTVSFDPDFDIPEVLAAHAARLGADPEVWRFATAPADIVDRFAAEFGVSVIREGNGTLTHSLRTTVIDADGRVAAVFPGNEWTAAQVLDAMRTALARAPR